MLTKKTDSNTQEHMYLYNKHTKSITNLHIQTQSQSNSIHFDVKYKILTKTHKKEHQLKTIT